MKKTALLVLLVSIMILSSGYRRNETYEIDADLIEDDDGYTASLYMNYASYNGYIKKLLGLIFILSDDFSVFEAKDNRDSDLLMCFTYHTHNVYLKDREITDFE